MCRKIECDTDIADTGGKWTESPSVQVKDATEVTSDQVPLHLDDRRVKSFNVPDCQPGSTHLSQLNESQGLLNITCHWFFEEHVDSSIEHIRSYFKMQVCGDYHCNEIGLCLFHHLAVIGVAFYMKPAHC